MVLTKMQTLVLWALLAKTGGASTQKNIRPDVKKSDREALLRAGLIASEKRGRELWLEITEKGWAWATTHLDADLPKSSTAGSVILRGWLTQIKAFMEARGLALADILGPQRVPESQPKSLPLGYADVRQNIRKTYLQLTRGR